MKGEKRRSISEQRAMDYQHNKKMIKYKNQRSKAQNRDTSNNRGSMIRVHPKPEGADELADDHLGDHMNQKQPLKAVIKKIHVQQKVRQFIAKLKRNNFTNKMELQTEEDDQKLQSFVRMVNELQEEAEQRFTRGVVLNPVVSLLVSVFTFLSVLYMQVISSWECFLYQFRALQMNADWLVTSQLICLFLTMIKILRNFMVIKTKHGYRLVKLESIAYDYLYSIQFITDILFMLSIASMLYRPYSIVPAFFTYVISIIVILLSPRIDEIIVSHIEVNNSTRQYLALVRLLLANAFFNHIIGSLYMAIAVTAPNHNWMNIYGIGDNFWLSKYNYSVYFAVSVTTTAVLGDVKPSNNRQTVLTMLVMLYGVIVWSYNIAQMTAIFANLYQIKQNLAKELQILSRIARVSKMNNTLHRQMANYLVHSSQLEFQSEMEERKNLILKLPQNLKAEYLDQNSQTFFKRMPFLSLLRSQSKKLLAQNVTLEINSPGQSITHKRQGMKEVNILKMGTVGMAFKKKNASLSGLILDKIIVQNDETDNPVLLNAFLFNRGKRLNYTLTCQSFCTVGKLQFEIMMQNLRECEVDYQFWRQFYDSDQALDEEWTIKECEECHQYHTMFNCPKKTYMPLRSMIFMKYSMGKSKSGLTLEHSKKQYEGYRTRYLKSIRERKNKYVKVSPLKYWKTIFHSLQKILEVNFQKNYHLHQRFNVTKKQWKIKNGIMKLLDDKFQFNEGDVPCDFEYYFKRNNPKNLIRTNLRTQKQGIVTHMASI